ncbi:hypothetical protein RB653_003024 [Dictyostelium firmibasis]|uniref:methionyl-tRNA formyltransferase n=1 Tax=Dictyostelium firmibasis TaxID=79012 RepID=A0AAN7YQJ5_9MYCE
MLLSRSIFTNKNSKLFNNFSFRYFTTSTIKSPPYRILFFGTDNVSLPILKSLHENQKLKTNNLVKELQVICPKSEKKELVEEYAIENGLKITYPDAINGMKGFQVPKITTGEGEEGNEELFDLAVVVSFGHFIPKSVLSKFKYGGINMHPSLLPRHRGAAPIYHQILSDDDNVGISVIELHHERFDCGKILKQVKLEPYDKDKILYNQLLSKLVELGSENVMSTIKEFPEFSQNALNQSEQGKTLASKVNRKMSKLEWSSQTANEIWILYKAFSDNIGLHTMIHNKKSKNDKRIKVREMLKPTDSTNEMYKQLLNDIENYEINNPPLKAGAYFLENDKSKSYHNIMWVKCKDGWVGITKLFEEGKKNTVKSSEFLFGKNIISINDKNNSIPDSQILF